MVYLRDGVNLVVSYISTAPAPQPDGQYHWLLIWGSVASLYSTHAVECIMYVYIMHQQWALCMGNCNVQPRVLRRCFGMHPTQNLAIIPNIL